MNEQKNAVRVRTYLWIVVLATTLPTCLMLVFRATKNMALALGFSGKPLEQLAQNGATIADADVWGFVGLAAIPFSILIVSIWRYSE